MTNEEIAALREMADETPRGPFGGRILRADSEPWLPRLLDEREDLLKASARLDAWIARTISGELDTEARSALADFRNAIAKASAP